MPKIQIELTNYKGIDALTYPLSNCDAIIVGGDNMMGKTSVIDAILENLNVKNLTQEPLKRGEKSGEKSIIVEDIHGNEIKIIHTFEKKNPSGTFYAIQDGKKISSLKAIRELMGETNMLTIDEYFQQCKTTKGRRDFINDILMRLLTKEEIKEIEDINGKVLKDGTLYKKRTDIRARIDTLEAMPKATDEEKELLKNKEALTTEKTKLESDINVYKKYNTSVSNLTNLLEKNKKFIEDNTILKENYSFIKVANLSLTITNLLSIFDDKALQETTGLIAQYPIALKKKIDELDARLVIVNADLDKIKNIEYKNSSFSDSEKELVELKKDEIANDKEIADFIDRKNEILKSSNLPEGLSIDGESDFTYNGFNFNASEISESEGWLLLAKLIIPIFSCKYFRMGNASIYGKKVLDQIMQIAVDNGKLIALEKVIDDSYVYVEGVVYDEVESTSTKSTTKETKPKEEPKVEATDNKVTIATEEITDGLDLDISISEDVVEAPIVEDNVQESKNEPSSDLGIDISIDEPVGDKMLREASEKRIEKGNAFPSDIPKTEEKKEEAPKNTARAEAFIKKAEERIGTKIDSELSPTIDTVDFKDEIDSYNQDSNDASNNKDFGDEDVEKLEGLFGDGIE